MATVSIKVRKCDVCQADGADKWFVQPPDGRRLEVDLCNKHSRPIEEAVVNGRPGRVTRNTVKDGMVVATPKPRGRPRKVKV